MPLNIPGGVPGVMGMPFGGPGMGAIGVGMIPPNALLGQNKGVMPPGLMGPIGGNIPQMGGMMNVAPTMGEANPKTKLEQLIRDKEKFLKMEPNTARRLVLGSLKYAV